MLGLGVDKVVFYVIVGGLLESGYWFYLRVKREESPDIREMNSR